jgi:hypothetical protein
MDRNKMDKKTKVGAAIVNSVVKDKITEGMPIEEKAKICFETAVDDNNTWFIYDENTLFLISISVLMVNSDEEEKSKIRSEIKFMQNFNMGNLTRAMEEIHGIEIIGLQKIWKKIWNSSRKKL